MVACSPWTAPYPEKREAPTAKPRSETRVPEVFCNNRSIHLSRVLRGTRKKLSGRPLTYERYGGCFASFKRNKIACSPERPTTDGMGIYARYAFLCPGSHFTLLRGGTEGPANDLQASHPVRGGVPWRTVVSPARPLPRLWKNSSVESGKKKCWQNFQRQRSTLSASVGQKHDYDYGILNVRTRIKATTPVKIVAPRAPFPRRRQLWEIVTGPWPKKKNGTTEPR